MQDGTVHEIRQGHMRGGAQAPLTDAEITAKFFDNADLWRLGREQADRVARRAGRAVRPRRRWQGWCVAGNDAAGLR